MLRVLKLIGWGTLAANFFPGSGRQHNSAQVLEKGNTVVDPRIVLLKTSDGRRENP